MQYASDRQLLKTILDIYSIVASSKDVARGILKVKTIDRLFDLFLQEMRQSSPEKETVRSLVMTLSKLSDLDSNLESFRPSSSFIDALVKCIRVKAFERNANSDESESDTNDSAASGAARFLHKRVTSSCRYVSSESFEEREFEAKLSNVFDLEEDLSVTRLKFNKRFYEIKIVDEEAVGPETTSTSAPENDASLNACVQELRVRVTSLQSQSDFAFANVGAHAIDTCDTIGKRIESVPESERLYLKRAPAPSKFKCFSVTGFKPAITVFRH